MSCEILDERDSRRQRKILASSNVAFNQEHVYLLQCIASLFNIISSADNARVLIWPWNFLMFL